MANKFVSDKKPRDWAEHLAKVQKEVAVTRAKLRELQKEEDQLTRFLLKVNKGKSFEYDGPDYRKVMQVSHPSMMILDQEQCKKLLKLKTPYKKVTRTKVTIDYVYED